MSRDSPRGPPASCPWSLCAEARRMSNDCAVCTPWENGWANRGGGMAPQRQCKGPNDRLHSSERGYAHCDTLMMSTIRVGIMPRAWTFEVIPYPLSLCPPNRFAFLHPHPDDFRDRFGQPLPSLPRERNSAVSAAISGRVGRPGTQPREQLEQDHHFSPLRVGFYSSMESHHFSSSCLTRIRLDESAGLSPPMLPLHPSPFPALACHPSHNAVVLPNQTRATVK